MPRNSLITSSIFLLCLLLFCGVPVQTFSQCLTSVSIQDSLIRIDKNTKLNNKQKLDCFYSLKNLVDKCKLPRDSVYGAITFRIGILENRC